MTEIPLGSETLARYLFSYPPNNNEITSTPELLAQTLPQTIEKYIGSSLKRDAFDKATVRVTSRTNKGELQYFAQIDGAAGPAYAGVLPEFLKAGKTAHDTSVAVSAQWDTHWRFFLPLGLALTNHLSVQLMHFPPSYVLERAQDYLNANTTNHWADLLEANGASKGTLDQYQTIVDMAPIAAGATEGQKVGPVALKYGEYIIELLRTLVQHGHHVRPVVAFGGVVRDWLRKQKVTLLTTYGPEGNPFRCGILDLNGLNVPVLEANHPSYILVHQKTVKDNRSTPENERLTDASLLQIMQQDLIAAGWQVRMAAKPDMDAMQALTQSQAHWTHSDQHAKIVELLARVVGRKPTPDVVESGLNPQTELGKNAREMVSNVLYGLTPGPERTAGARL